jgi:ABC-type sugar transport system ATPase subunit
MAWPPETHLKVGDVDPILRAENISKSFPGVRAVDDVSFTLMRREILAIVGENGAGKTTLMKILGGVEQADQGRMYLDGKQVSFASPIDAIEAGLSMVFQELSLVTSLTIGENIFANRQPVGRFDTIRWDELHARTSELLSRFDLVLDPGIQVKRLGMGQQQIVEILKAISTDPNVLILDEPTSSLTKMERSDLFENIRKLKHEGMTFIYITHKLDEVFELADRVMVMRDGKHVGTQMVSEVSEENLVRMMVGRGIKDMYGSSAEDARPGEPYFSVEGLSRKGAFHEVSFELARGEILGFSGLVGAGRTELARTIFGLESRDEGRVYLNGEEMEIHHPSDAIKHGIAYLTEDRAGQGLFLDMTIRDNLIAPKLDAFVNAVGFLNHAEIASAAQELVNRFDIITPSLTQKVLNLSGGNQQKCMVAMWMGIQPEVVIVDEPTRGVDVGARSDIYHKLRQYAQGGTGVIMISSDLQELLGMCDRILVMHEGLITGEVLRDDFSEELIISYAAGIRNGPGITEEVATAREQR